MYILSWDKQQICTKVESSTIACTLFSWLILLGTFSRYGLLGTTADITDDRTLIQFKQLRLLKN